MPEIARPLPDPALSEPEVGLSAVARFVRQLSHDLRNHLNAAELQSAYIGEIAEDAEIKTEITRLRGMLGEMGESLQRLTLSLAPVSLTEMPYEARAFVEDLQQKAASRFPEASEEVRWEVQVAGEMLEIDPQLLQEAMLELISNAFLHGRGTGPILAAARVSEQEFTFSLHEPKTDFQGTSEGWGMEPFQKVRHGHYGLGLLRVRRIVDAHRGALRVHYDSPTSALVTRVVLPLGPGS